MKTCYPNHERACICGGIERTCFQCNKVISDCEWITNWGSCGDCFDKHYDAAVAEGFVSATECQTLIKLAEGKNSDS